MWWEYLIFGGVLIFAGYAFVSLARFQARIMTRKTDRRAEDLYESYADGPRRHRRLTRRHNDG
ncbi:MAG TPA: hypothetical protein VHU92_05080 [Streptosporangiaceae bacterium]|jgi:hypothetical protein|nr:hypothetical protein [Streptosporangiaceae bacterium]